VQNIMQNFMQRARSAMANSMSTAHIDTAK